MVSPVAVPRARFGGLLRAWRSSRGRSQLALALDAGISSRHLSYMETGRARPSREMVLTLAQALEIPLRDRNDLLEAAGFAALYRETPLDAPALGPVRDALSVLLNGSEPNPAFVVNRRYDILDANATGRWMLSSFAHDLTRFELPYNMARLVASPHGLRPHLENWQEVARKVFVRLRRELGGAHVRDATDEALLAEIEPAFAELRDPPIAADAPPLMVGVQFRRAGVVLNLFTTIATLGTALDVTLQELRIETLFPADAASKRLLADRANIFPPPQAGEGVFSVDR
ncbi:MAG TPA: helix-turn-helix transcriptional regulator [Burkholderiaceae bacterium]|nr:helix-turn-helix transcriptional regulator [Burkholderiaceae bacterium]